MNIHVYTHVHAHVFAVRVHVCNSKVVCTQFYVVGTTGSVLIRDVSLIQCVLYSDAPLDSQVVHSACIRLL